MIELKPLRVWFVTGSQHLYGAETLRQVAAHAQAILMPLPDRAQAHVAAIWARLRWLPAG